MQGLEKKEGVAVGAQEGNGWSSVQGGERGPGRVMQMIESWVLKDKVVSQTEGEPCQHIWIPGYGTTATTQDTGAVWCERFAEVPLGRVSLGLDHWIPSLGIERVSFEWIQVFFFWKATWKIIIRFYPSVWLKFSLVRNKWKIITKTAKRDPGVLPRADVLFRKGTLVPWGRGIRRQTSKRDRWGGYAVSQATTADTERNRDQMFQGSNLQAPKWMWAVRAEGAGRGRLEYLSGCVQETIPSYKEGVKKGTWRKIWVWLWT